MAETAAGAAGVPGPELIMVSQPEAELRLQAGRAHAAAGDVTALNRALDETAATPRSLFGPSEERVKARQQASPWDEPDLSLYYRVHLEPGADHEAVAKRLAEEEAVAGAYVKPAPMIDTSLIAERPAEALAPAAAPTVTPDFTSRQNYLDPPPSGVDARSAWNQQGGDGAGVDVIMVGGAWRLEHEDLRGGAPAVIAGTQIDSLSFRNHGTAMLGVVRADRNAFGVTGVATGCRARLVATFGLGTAGAINAAANALSPGAVMVIEWQRPGPGATGVGSAGFISIEWWPDDFAAILAATIKGVIVIAPAGNGGVSLDDPTYAQPLPGFPPTWRNPFARGTADSGSILVGAGSPPDQTHGRPQAVDRSRLAFSNYGSCVDVQGWGAEVTTLAYGDLQGGTDETLWYTDVFGGTSAAAALIGGVVASLQGVNIGGGSKRPPLTPGQVRQFLRGSGSAQQAGATNPVTQNIGSRPALMALIAMLPQPKSESKDGKDTKDTPKENKDTKDTKDSKDNKDNKDNKESKDSKDGKDNKDGKDHKDHKDSKGDKTETPKEHKDGNAIEKISAIIEPAPRSALVITPIAWPVEDPTPVQHFIPVSQRPNLVTAALLDEADLPPDGR